MIGEINREFLSNCVFCQIGKGEDRVSTRIISNQEDTIALLVLHPQTRGHFIVFPQNHFSNLEEAGELMSSLILKTITLASRVTHILNAPAYVLRINNKVYELEDDPRHIGHIHIHVIPRYTSRDNISSDPLEPPQSYFIELKEELNHIRT